MGRPDAPAEVPETIQNLAVSKKTQVIGCLVIIFRLRNNLFHGEKWRYELVGDQDN